MHRFSRDLRLLASLGEGAKTQKKSKFVVREKIYIFSKFVKTAGSDFYFIIKIKMLGDYVSSNS